MGPALSCFLQCVAVIVAKERLLFVLGLVGIEWPVKNADHQVCCRWRWCRGENVPAHLIHHQQVSLRIRTHSKYLETVFFQRPWYNERTMSSILYSVNDTLHIICILTRANASKLERSQRCHWKRFPQRQYQANLNVVGNFSGLAWWQSFLTKYPGCAREVIRPSVSAVVKVCVSLGKNERAARTLTKCRKWPNKDFPPPASLYRVDIVWCLFCRCLTTMP